MTQDEKNTKPKMEKATKFSNLFSLSQLQQMAETAEVCPICDEAFEADAVLLACLHPLCYNCLCDVERVAAQDGKKTVCPVLMCGEPFVRQQLIQRVTSTTQHDNMCHVHTSYEIAMFCQTCFEMVCDECNEHESHTRWPLSIAEVKLHVFITHALAELRSNRLPNLNKAILLLLETLRTFEKTEAEIKERFLKIAEANVHELRQLEDKQQEMISKVRNDAKPIQAQLDVLCFIRDEAILACAQADQMLNRFFVNSPSDYSLNSPEETTVPTAPSTTPIVSLALPSEPANAQRWKLLLINPFSPARTTRRQSFSHYLSVKFAPSRTLARSCNGHTTELDHRVQMRPDDLTSSSMTSKFSSLSRVFLPFRREFFSSTETKIASRKASGEANVAYLKKRLFTSTSAIQLTAGTAQANISLVDEMLEHAYTVPSGISTNIALSISSTSADTSAASDSESEETSRSTSETDTTTGSSLVPVVSKEPLTIEAMRRCCVLISRLNSLIASEPVLKPTIKIRVVWAPYRPFILHPDDICTVLQDRDYRSTQLPVAILSGIQVPQTESGYVADYEGPDPFLKGPTGVCVGPDGNLVVCDCSMRRVRIISPDGTIIRDIPVQIRPYFVAITADGLLWISSAELHYVTSFHWSTGIPASHPIPIYQVWGVAVRKNGDVIGSGAGTVRAFKTDRTERWCSQGDHLAYAHACVVTEDDEVVVSDTGGDCVQVLRGEDGLHLRTIGKGIISRPNGVTVSPDGFLIVTESRENTICVFDFTTGAFIHRWGSRAKYPDPVPGRFDGPFGCTVLSDGRLVVSDHHNDRLQIF